jgi:hypothetical protein
MKDLKGVIIYSLIAGLLITLLSGLMPTITDVAGMNYWGSPWPWLTQTNSGDSEAQKVIIFENVLFDSIIWSIVIFSGYYLFEKAVK